MALSFLHACARSPAGLRSAVVQNTSRGWNHSLVKSHWFASCMRALPSYVKMLNVVG
jgi:hypothetical protein